MKKVVLIVLLCLILSSCSSDSSNTTEEIPQAEGAPDYSSHTAPDEDLYKTILADPAKLSSGEPVFATEVPASDWSGRMFGGFTKDSTQYDVREVDISDQDFSAVDHYNALSFSTNTVWPDQLPDDFDPDYLLEHNKNPGLGIRALHESGITGKGVGIAIIDQALLLEHEQYKDNLMYYEQIHCADGAAQLHGPAVASIAVGKTVGVAPGATLYYIAETHGHDTENVFEFDASIIADCILRVLEINRHLPAGEKIRVISISKGYSPEDQGYDALANAIEQADQENIFVITTSTQLYYDFKLFGMDREYSNDPDDRNSYLPAGWIEDDFYANPGNYQDDILFPMGSRTIAACTGAQNYELSYEGGMSWAVPWCAGLYALCCEVRPDLTPQQFTRLLADTGETINLSHDGESYRFGKIVNPAAMIEALR